ncbi:ROK family protein [Companilactobacillus kimchii]|uniref:Transcriptional regulator sugar kinase n=2 Tax=Companilactobacillus kimchii TaxID=2801452 RepID=A0ABR5NSM4_9LACO|nr:ROK family protein [Companilactobacillus kimchii]KAE9562167.1 transcriptional regulator [Companilactobacillus kimchii]KRK51213.1 transcriptional regulator sugar kinase [Companilactobacillus kimchii DSM 13961 = JCM 10707]OWF34305.1 Glucokinase [Companilactobacillus kimchii]GEO46226.1 sugar kinase [Companilactobacillus paralimentarius]
MINKYLVFDVGGTNVKYAIIDRSGKLIEKNSMVTLHSLNDFISSLQKIIDYYRGSFTGIAFSVPGRVSHDDGKIYGGGSLPFMDKKSLADLINTDVPVAVENDGKAAALSELWLGNLKDIKNGAAIVLGTGVGGGIIMNHQLIYGSHFQAGEVSFLVNNSKKLGYDDLEGSSGSAVKMINECATKLGLNNKNDGKRVFEEINKDNDSIMPIFERYCRNIATLIHNIQAIIDLDRYVIGGGISSQPIVAQTINQEFIKLRSEVPIIQTTLSKPKIINSKFKNDANLYGALYNWLMNMDNYFQNKGQATN